ncbi:hypothetical protein LRAMOSA00701 [Lichtheimia ramosa]|uniref:Ubiquinol-cytochrome c chaperone domain-containing protein n=1 Tax=Lichtheimia ramosa TaxID=688394 RepID=A0A077W9M8_9FUNG|nr:hypothetical protein LRAMOSA00701 [Lichtheimia ramosa]
MVFVNALKNSAFMVQHRPTALRPLLQHAVRMAPMTVQPSRVIVARLQSTTTAQQNGSEKKYSDTTKKLVYGLARMLGWNSKPSVAIRTSHQLYNACAKQVEANKAFFIEACNLPDNFQSWFSVTQLHVWMLMVRLRADSNGKMLIQELVNRLFEDAEARIREHDITQQRMINNYIQDFLAQFHGGVVSYDEGMCKDDPVLAAALWRNLFAPTSNDAVNLALVVQYIRRELKALDELDGEKLNAGIVQFGKPDMTF